MWKGKVNDMLSEKRSFAGYSPERPSRIVLQRARVNKTEQRSRRAQRRCGIRDGVHTKERRDSSTGSFAQSSESLYQLSGSVWRQLCGSASKVVQGLGRQHRMREPVHILL